MLTYAILHCTTIYFYYIARSLFACNPLWQVRPDVFAHNAALSFSEEVKRWQGALSCLLQMKSTEQALWAAMRNHFCRYWSITRQLRTKTLCTKIRTLALNSCLEVPDEISHLMAKRSHCWHCTGTWLPFSMWKLRLHCLPQCQREILTVAVGSEHPWSLWTYKGLRGIVCLVVTLNKGVVFISSRSFLLCIPRHRGWCKANCSQCCSECLWEKLAVVFGNFDLFPTPAVQFDGKLRAMTSVFASLFFIRNYFVLSFLYFVEAWSEIGKKWGVLSVFA